MARRSATLRLKSYAVVSRAVDEGLSFGVRRAFKHRESDLSDDDFDAIAEQCHHEVMLALDAVVRWDDET